MTSFVVMYKQKSETAAVYLLQNMAVFDSLLLAVSIVIYTLPSVYPYTGRLQALHNSFDYISRYVWPPAMMLHTVTIWLTVLVTVDRYNAVCRAIEEYGGSAHFRSVRRQVALVVVASVVYNAPRFFEHQSVEEMEIFSGDNGNNETSSTRLAYNDSNTTTAPSQPSASYLGANPIYQIVYSNLMYYPVMYLIPLSMLGYLNSKLISALNSIRRRKLLRQSAHLSTASGVAATTPKVTRRRGSASGSSSTRREGDTITLCVVAIVCIFIVCQTPALLNQIFWAFGEPEDRDCGRFHFYYTKLSDVLVVFNCSCNFAVYCLFGRKFRRDFIRTVLECCCCCKQWTRRALGDIETSRAGHSVSLLRPPAARRPQLNRASLAAIVEQTSRLDAVDTVYTVSPNNGHVVRERQGLIAFDIPDRSQADLRVIEQLF